MTSTKDYSINASSIIDGMLFGVWYSRSNRYTMEIINELKDRINGIFTAPRKVTADECDLLYSTLVYIYGDYGTSPRTGWIYEEMKPAVLKAIDSWVNDMSNALKLDD